MPSNHLSFRPHAAMFTGFACVPQDRGVNGYRGRSDDGHGPLYRSGSGRDISSRDSWPGSYGGSAAGRDERDVPGGMGSLRPARSREHSPPLEHGSLAGRSPRDRERDQREREPSGLMRLGSGRERGERERHHSPPGRDAWEHRDRDRDREGLPSKLTSLGSAGGTLPPYRSHRLSNGTSDGGVSGGSHGAASGSHHGMANGDLEAGELPDEELPLPHGSPARSWGSGGAGWGARGEGRAPFASCSRSWQLYISSARLALAACLLSTLHEQPAAHPCYHPQLTRSFALLACIASPGAVCSVGALSASRCVCCVHTQADGRRTAASHPHDAVTATCRLCTAACLAPAPSRVRAPAALRALSA